MLQAVTTPIPQPSPSHKWILWVARSLKGLSLSGGEGREVLWPCFLPEDIWSGQSWSRFEISPSYKIKDVLSLSPSPLSLSLFFPLSQKNHNLSQMIPANGSPHYSCFLFWSGLSGSARLALWVQRKFTALVLCYAIQLHCQFSQAHVHGTGWTVFHTRTKLHC